MRASGHHRFQPRYVVRDHKASDCTDFAQGLHLAAETRARRQSRSRLAVALADGKSAILECSAESPLHLFTPRCRGKTVWVIAATYGGGLVAGDVVDLDVEVGQGASALLGTQSFNRVYRSDGPWAEQHLSARVEAGGVLAVLPEPTSCFAGARYRQEQRFDLEKTASLVLLDALSAGRSARGERWAFADYGSRNRVTICGKPLLSDAIGLSPNEGEPLTSRMRDVELLATLVLVGPAFSQIAHALLDEIAGKPAAPGAEFFAVASPIADGVHLRVASRTVEAGLAYVYAKLEFAKQLFGDNPFDRRP